MISHSQIRQYLLISIIVILFGLIFWNLRVFIPALLGAYTLYIILKDPTHYLVEKYGWRHNIAAATMMLISFLVILIPSYVFIEMLRERLVHSVQQPTLMLEKLQKALGEIESDYNVKLLNAERMKTISNWGINTVSDIANSTLVGLALLIIAYFILWFMLSAGKQKENHFFNWLPLKPKNISLLRKELNSMVYSNAIGIPLMGIVQCIAGYIGYRIAGAEDIWFWVFLTFIAGMVPIFGVLLAFLPLSLVLLADGHTWQAAFVFIYGFIVIGSVDNLARMWLLKKIGHTHPFITLFGVIMGLQFFGFVGFIFGPILIAMFFLLVRIYHEEYKHPEEEKINPEV